MDRLPPRNLCFRCFHVIKFSEIFAELIVFTNLAKVILTSALYLNEGHVRVSTRRDA